MQTLTLDVSTNCTGFAVFEDKILIASGAWRTNTTKARADIYDKLSDIEERLLSVHEEYDIGRVLIEKPLSNLGKRKGKKTTTPQTIAILNKFNGSVSYMCYKIFGVKPKHLSFKSCRNRAGVAIEKNVKAKVKVMEWAQKNVPSFKPRITRQGNIAQECYDEADALIIGFGFFA